MKLSNKEANDVYDILVRLGGAAEHMRDAFVSAHITEEKWMNECCQEWRFCGWLGFGGKYWSRRNVVDCYREDETPERLELIKKMNEELKKVRTPSNKYGE